jgi:hypothetical protein
MKLGVVYLSRAMTKPTQCVCDQHGSRPACASAQSDQDPRRWSLSALFQVEELIANNMDPDLDPCWSQTHFNLVGFVMAQLISIYHIASVSSYQL